MDLIINLPLLLNKEMHVDYHQMQKIIEFDETVKGVMLFSKENEGETFSLKEKIEIFSKIKNITSIPLIYVNNKLMIEEEINAINYMKPDYVLLSLVKDPKLSSKGFERYVFKIFKCLNSKVILYLDDSFENCKISYKTIVNIMRTKNNFYGIYDNTKDTYFLKKISSLDKIFLSTSLTKYIDYPIKKNLNGIVNDFYVVFQKEITQYFYESSFGFVNPVLINYLKFIDECINLYPRSMAIKYLLSKRGYTSCYSKIPYYTLKGDEKNKLDFIF